MEIVEEFKSKNDTEIWEIVTKYINEKKSFHSVRGIKYVAEVKNDSIFYRGGSGARAERGESIIKDEFCEAFENIRDSELINTNTIKDKIPNSIYAQRTPLIGLLLSTNIIKNKALK